MGVKSIIAPPRSLCWLVVLLFLISLESGGEAGRSRPSSTSKECSWDPTTSTLDCHLSLNEVVAATTTVVFPKHQREATNILRLRCVADRSSNSISTGAKSHQHQAAQSNLRVNYGLRRSDGRRGGNLWPHLHSLQIRDCPLSSMNVGLGKKDAQPDQSIRSLRTKQKNSDVLSDVVKPLLGGTLPTGIRHLEITGAQNVEDMSSGSWCDLGSNLISLNLSDNALKRLPLHLRTHHNASRCTWSHMEAMHLSGNKITRLEKVEATSILSLAGASPSFALLNLADNRIQKFELPNHIAHLTHLDLSNNRLLHFPSEALMHSALQLREIHLQGNILTSLPSVALVAKLESLVFLNVSRNDINFDSSSVEGGSLDGMAQLVALDLSHNKISGLVDEIVFQDLANLQVLSLAHNQIRGFSEDAFLALKRLHVLVLSHNDVDDGGLPEGLFRHLSDLRSLSLDHNRLRNLAR